MNSLLGRQQFQTVLALELKRISRFKILYFLLCFLIICLIFTSCNSKGNIIQSLESPDGKYVAYLFEKDSGATAWFIYRLTILKKADKFKFTNGNTYSSKQIFDIEWIDSNALMVNNYDAKEFFLQNDEVGKIKVLYQVTE